MTPPPDTHGQLSAHLDRLPAAVMATTLSGQITASNRRLDEWTGTEIVPGDTAVHDLVTATSSLLLETGVIHQLSLEGHFDDVVLELVCPDGSALHTLWAARQVDDEVLWIGLDISARRDHEREAEATRRRLQLLQRLSADLVGADAPAEIGRAMLDQLVDGMKADWGVIVAADDAAETIASRSIGTATVDDRRLDALVDRARDGRSPVFLSDSGDGLDETEQIAVIPLVAGAEPLGTVCLRLERAEPYDELERQLLLAAAEMTSSALGRATLLERLELAAELNLRLSGLLHSLETASTLAGRSQLIAETLVADHADLVTVSLVESAQLAGLRHVDPSKEDAVRWLHARLVRDGRLAGETSGDRTSRSTDGLDPAVLDRIGFAADEAAVLASLEISRFEELPLVARGRRIGLLSLGWIDPKGRRRTDLADFHARLADACALALDNARLFELEYNTAQQLQSALLPKRLPIDPRFTLHAYYRAANETANVGGDWYDAFWLSTDRIGLVVGDVVGGGLAAARTMSELRSATGAFAREGQGVARTLERLHHFASTSAEATASTLAYMELDLIDGRLEFGCAGHLPPVFIAGGETRLLWDGRSPVLGMLGDSPQPVGRVHCDARATVVLYTDGLIERKGRSIDVGLEELRSVLADDPTLAREPERLGTALRSDGHNDDTCVLALEVSGVR